MQAQFSLFVMLTATVIGLTAHPAQAQVFQSEGIDASPLNQSFSNIYQYPDSSPGQSHSNIYQPPTVYTQPSYPQGYPQPVYGQPRVIYQQPSVIYRRTEIVSPDGNRRVILEDPQYVIPNNGVIMNPDDLRSVGDHRRYHHRYQGSNNYRRSSGSIYYRF
jgi:hypothetical protein